MDYLEIFEALERVAFSEAEDIAENRNVDFNTAYQDQLRALYRGAYLVLHSLKTDLD